MLFNDASGLLLDPISIHFKLTRPNFGILRFITRKCNIGLLIMCNCTVKVQLGEMLNGQNIELVDRTRSILLEPMG